MAKKVKDEKVQEETTMAKARRKRVSRSFPAAPFEEALELPLAIQRIGGGEKVRRLTLFEQLDKSPESGPSRMMNQRHTLRPDDRQLQGRVARADGQGPAGDEWRRLRARAVA